MSALVQQLKNAVAVGAVSHSYVVVGNAIDMPKLLRSCAKAIMCPNGGCSCAVCRKIDNSLHGDVLQFPAGASLKVDDISTVLSESVMRPIDNGNCRIFLIDATNSMGITSSVWQNKLLKTLEEPPKGVHLIIGVTSTSGLLQTVLSRSQVLSSGSMPFEKMVEVVCRDYNLATATVAVSIADGDVDLAMEYARDSKITLLYNNLLDMFVNMTSTASSLQYASNFVRDKGYSKQLLALMSAILRDRIMWATNLKLVRLDIDSQLMTKIASNYSLSASSEIIKLIDQANRLLTSGANFPLTIDKLLANMLEAKYLCRR